MTLQIRLKALQPILIVLLLAIFLRAWAVSLLPQDFDEPVYLQAAFDYADALRAGDVNAVIDYPGVIEHPAFVKLLYSGAVLALGKLAAWTNAFYASQAVSAFFGVLAVLFVSLAVDPLAGGMLAVHTLAVKYTSQVYLEAVPHAMTIAAVLAFLKTDKEKPGRGFWLSAAALGVAAASKYSYLPVILVVLWYLALFEKKIRRYWYAAYAALALGVFFALDVSLWHDPLNRLYESLFYHVQYSQGAHVQEGGYPWYQPFVWIFTSPPGEWHPNVFFYFGFDGIISVFAVARIKREWKERRWLVVWLTAGMLFLLLWPAKWPQYALTVTPVLCIMSAESVRRFVHWVRIQETYWNYLKEMFPKPEKWLWVAIGAFALFVAAIYLSVAVKLAVGRVGWSNVTRQNSFLPSNTVYDLLPLGDGSMLIATGHGAAFWTPPEATDQPGTWIIFNTKNSGLPSDEVLSLVQDSNGNFWFGTDKGLARYDGHSWTTFDAKSLGLSDERVISLATSNNGAVFAGTLAGASTWNGTTWTPIDHAGDKPVFALTISGDSLWIGIPEGAWRIAISEGQWEFYPTNSAVNHILVASDGTVWAATSGEGLARLEGSEWTYFRTGNSGIPYNTVNWVTEVSPGQLWVGTSHPTNAGGAAAWFDGEEWYAFWYNNSGASAAEVTVLAVQSGQVWMGTRTQGIDLYQLGK